MSIKLNPEEIVKRVKAKQAAGAKSNHTFRLNDQLMEDFKANCERNGISMTSMIEETIKILVYGDERK